LPHHAAVVKEKRPERHSRGKEKREEAEYHERCHKLAL
jgi:hypothetical protein